MNYSAIRRMAAFAAGIALTGGTLAACGGSDSDAKDEGAAPTTGVLSGVCPATVVFQADWEPESEHGSIYSLLGDDYTIDKANFRTTGSLMDGDTDTGVDLEIRIGGSSVGYQDPTSLMYQDDDILLGYGRVGDTIATDSKNPVVHVMATMAKSPYAIYWDPATYPDVKTIADLKAKNISILTQGDGQSATWTAFLAGSGVLNASQYDDSSGTKPSAFVAAGGKVAEVGFITAEPHMYQDLVKAWGKPVVGQTIGDAGYPEYFQSIVVRKDDVTAQADCLGKLVPIIQRGLAGFIESPESTNDKIVDIVETYDNSWQYEKSSAEYATTTAVELGILGPGADGVIGSYDTATVQKLIDITKKYRTDVEVADTITPETLVTNKFLDTSVK